MNLECICWTICQNPSSRSHQVSHRGGVQQNAGGNFSTQCVLPPVLFCAWLPSNTTRTRSDYTATFQSVIAVHFGSPFLSCTKPGGGANSGSNSHLRKPYIFVPHCGWSHPRYRNIMQYIWVSTLVVECSMFFSVNVMIHMYIYIYTYIYIQYK